MSRSFSTLFDEATFADGLYSASISENWMQGRTTYGGLSAALCYDAAIRAFPDSRPMRSAMVNFIGPAGGNVSGEVRLLRQGKSVSFVESDISGEKGLATRTVFCFGASRESAFNDTFAAPHGQPGPDGLEPYISGGLAPHFTSQFESRLASGGRPGDGGDAFHHHIWVRHKDPKASGMAALLAIADIPPPAVMPMFKTFAPVSSMTWMINVLVDNPQTEDGWWLLSTRAENAAGGYSSQDMLIWNMAGELVVGGRQSVAIFG